MVEAMGLRITAASFPSMASPKASNASMRFVSYSQHLAFVSMVTLMPMSFLPYSKVHAMAAIVASATDGM
jgi:hypothetical protein